MIRKSLGIAYRTLYFFYFAMIVAWVRPCLGDSFKIGVGVNQLYPDEARIVTATPGPRMRCDAIFGPVSLLTVTDERAPNPQRLLYKGEVLDFIKKLGGPIIVSEDVAGWPSSPAHEWRAWSRILGRAPDRGMVYSELGGLVQGTPPNADPRVWRAPWTLTAVPGFVPNPFAMRMDFGVLTPAVWDTCLDRSWIENYVRVHKRGKILLLNRHFRDFPAAPYRSHALDSLKNKNTSGIVFEIETSLEYLLGQPPRHVVGRNIAEGIKEVLRRDKEVYLLLSPGPPNGRPYSERVRDVVTTLARQGVPMNDGRLTIVVACYEQRSNVGFLSDGAGADSVEAAVDWLHRYRGH